MRQSSIISGKALITAANPNNNNNGTHSACGIMSNNNNIVVVETGTTLLVDGRSNYKVMRFNRFMAINPRNVLFVLATL